MVLITANREAFDGFEFDRGGYELVSLSDCVWDAPKGFPFKPVLSVVYGAELKPLFRDILEVPNATFAEARRFLVELREDKSTAMADVSEVYLFMQNHYSEE
jgi:hypothetical protein